MTKVRSLHSGPWNYVDSFFSFVVIQWSRKISSRPQVEHINNILFTCSLNFWMLFIFLDYYFDTKNGYYTCYLCFYRFKLWPALCHFNLGSETMRYILMMSFIRDILENNLKMTTKQKKILPPKKKKKQKNPIYGHCAITFKTKLLIFPKGIRSLHVFIIPCVYMYLLTFFNKHDYAMYVP